PPSSSLFPYTTLFRSLLILWFGFDERTATGTSLAAIVIIAAVAAAVQGGYGNVHVGDGLLVGGPALIGVVFGTALQQRVPMRVVDRKSTRLNSSHRTI